jgi:crotonobetainyl-CoA:carnitine CoA-transferase CaiB-like acyl-CoA transferase
VAINLRRPEGLVVLARLVPHCDVLVENFSAGVLERWGFGYDRLRELRDDVIVVRMSGMGQTGPWAGHVTYADTLAAVAGVTAQTAPGEDGPVGLAFGLGDMVAALHAAAATLAALEERAQTGRGREIDLSQLEALASQTGTSLLETAYGVPSPSRLVFQGVYPCRGEDRWVAVAVETDEQQRALDHLIGRHATLGAWTAERSRDEVAATLQAAGIAAAPVEDGRDLVDGDEHLRAREFYVELDHPVAGPTLHEGIAIRPADTPGAVRRPAPCLGEHTEEVLTELAGLSRAEIARLREAGVLE